MGYRAAVENQTEKKLKINCSMAGLGQGLLPGGLKEQEQGSGVHRTKLI